jgi:hypothetical protein
MQGVVRNFDPLTRAGVVMRDTDRTSFAFAPDALAGSLFVNLRQGQRIIFSLNDQGLATGVGVGSEADMGIPTAQV